MHYFSLLLYPVLFGVVALPFEIKRLILGNNDEILSYPEEPIIFVLDRDRNIRLSQMASKHNLTSNTALAETVVRLTSSNSYSQGFKTMTLHEYVNYTTTVNFANDISLSNETFYLFGGNFGHVFDVLHSTYVLPPCRKIGCDVAGAFSFGIAGSYTGVGFHVHGPVFSEQIVGAKRWFLFPPSHSIHFDPNMTIHEWVKKREENLGDHCANESNSLYEGIVVPGEILYLPAGWLHATYNLLSLDHYNIFMSLFIDPQLLPKIITD